MNEGGGGMVAGFHSFPATGVLFQHFWMTGEKSGRRRQSPTNVVRWWKQKSKQMWCGGGNRKVTVMGVVTERVFLVPKSCQDVLDFNNKIQDLMVNGLNIRDRPVIVPIY